MAYCSLEEAWGDSYISTKKKSKNTRQYLPDRYDTPEEEDTQIFSKKIRNSNTRNRKHKTSKGIRNIGYEPSPSVQGIIERTPPRTKKKKSSRKKTYFQRTMKKLPQTSGHEYRYKGGVPHGRVSAQSDSNKTSGKVQAFYNTTTSAYDSDSGDDAFSEYHPYVSDKATEQLSKYAGSLLGSRNLNNNKFIRQGDENKDDYASHEDQSQEYELAEEEYDVPEERYSSPVSREEVDTPIMEEESYYQQSTPSPHDEVENYRNISNQNRNTVSEDNTVFDEKELDQMPLINKLNELDKIEDQYEEEDSMPPRMVSSRENMFNIILYIVSGIFIIFILDIFVRLGKTFR